MMEAIYRARASLAACAGLLASACGPPSAEVSNWGLTREETGRGYAFTATALLQQGEGGWFMPGLLLTDERGCLRAEYFEAVHPRTLPDPDHARAQFRGNIPARWKIARARFTLTYHTGMNAAEAEEKVVFTEERVIDRSLRPPSMPSKPCSDRTAELRKPANSNPDSADSDAIDRMSRNEVLATAINTAGFLCARATDAYPESGSIIVRCQEYRNGRGKAKYRVDTEAMDVTKLD